MKRSEQFIQLLENLRGVYDDVDNRDSVDQLEHCLQMGTKAHEASMTDRMVALAVLHDSFRVIAPFNHGEALAIAIEDRLQDGELEILCAHSLWQHDILHGTSQTLMYQDQTWYSKACQFGILDADSFDPEYDSLPIEFFIPLIEKLLD